MPALPDSKLELFCQYALRHLAQGMSRGKALEAAGEDAGYRGSAAQANSRKRGNRKDVRARMIELAAPAQAEAEADVAVDVTKAKSRLAEIIMASVDWNETVMPKDVINAVKQLAAIEGWNAPTNVNLHDKRDPTDWTTAELVAFVVDAERRLAGNPPPDAGQAEPDSVH